MKKGLFYLLIFTLLVTVSCKEKPETTVDKNAIVSINGEHLYQKDIVNVLPKYLSKEDSTIFVDQYINNWIAERVFFLEAQSTLTDTSAIEAKVDMYRKQLYVHYYKEEFVYNDISHQISIEEIQDYYTKHLNDYVLAQTFVKAHYMTLDVDQYTYYDEREKINNSSLEDKKSLQDYCIGTGRKVYFVEEWTEFDRFLDMVDYFNAFDANELIFRSFFENTNEELRFLIKVDEFLSVGDYLPIELARDDIVQIILNKRKKDKYIQTKKELIEKGISSGTVIIN